VVIGRPRRSSVPVSSGNEGDSSVEGSVSYAVLFVEEAVIGNKRSTLPGPTPMK
jgi:hypothetical protein